jgi:hypothetical protein
VGDESPAFWRDVLPSRLTPGSNGDIFDLCQAFKEKKIFVSIQFDSSNFLDGLFTVARRRICLLLHAFSLIIFIQKSLDDFSRLPFILSLCSWMALFAIN